MQAHICACVVCVYRYRPVSVHVYMCIEDTLRGRYLATIYLL